MVFPEHSVVGIAPEGVGLRPIVPPARAHPPGRDHQVAAVRVDLHLDPELGTAMQRPARWERASTRRNGRRDA